MMMSKPIFGVRAGFRISKIRLLSRAEGKNFKMQNDGGVGGVDGKNRVGKGLKKEIN